MIDPSLFTVERILATMFYDMAGNVDRWRRHAEIIPAYMPPFPRSDTKPICVVKLGGSFLRNAGPHYFWDMYGDDMRTSEAALLALMRAPIPPWAIKREVFDGSLFERKEGDGP